MKSWNVRKVSPTEYHVIETRFVGESEYILARCTGPVPAGDIACAMRVAQSLMENRDTIHNAIYGINNALERFKFEMKEISNEPKIVEPEKIEDVHAEQNKIVSMPFGENTENPPPKVPKTCPTCNRVACTNRYFYNKKDCEQYVK